MTKNKVTSTNPLANTNANLHTSANTRAGNNTHRQLTHFYGHQVRILNDVFLSSILARLCSPEVFQPKINNLVETLYTSLINEVIRCEFSTLSLKHPTRMTASHPTCFLELEQINPQQKTICVNIARAGTWPSHICYHNLHQVIDAPLIRQDHIFASRMTDDQEQVTGSEFGGMKIGGDKQDAIVLFPDPMGATGNTILSALDWYKNKVAGKVKKFIALHLIVTPEYLRTVTSRHPDLIIYSLRLDRGLSDSQILETVPGTHWDLEKGLNSKQYIVPGGGGFGEIMNNSFV